MILKRMKRRHTRSEAIAFCRRLRAARPEMVFGADLIAGFPTETDEMFENSLRLIRECGLTHLHVFPFSPRHGAPAARMPQLDRAQIKARAAQLRALGLTRLEAHLDGRAGDTDTVLVERGERGRARDFSPVNLADLRAEPGEIVRIRFLARKAGALMGEPVNIHADEGEKRIAAMDAT